MTQYEWSLYVFQSVNGKRTLMRYPFTSWGVIEVHKFQQGWDYYDYLMKESDPGAVALVMVPLESNVMNRQYNITDKDIMEFAVLRANEAFKVLRKNLGVIYGVTEKTEAENKEKNKEDEEIEKKTDEVNNGHITFRQWYELQGKLGVKIGGEGIVKFCAPGHSVLNDKNNIRGLFSTNEHGVENLVSWFGDYPIVGITPNKVYDEDGTIRHVLQIKLMWK